MTTAETLEIGFGFVGEKKVRKKDNCYLLARRRHTYREAESIVNKMKQMTEIYSFLNGECKYYLIIHIKKLRKLFHLIFI